MDKSYIRIEGGMFHANFYGYCERCEKQIMPGLKIGQQYQAILCVPCFKAAQKKADKTLRKQVGQ